MQMQIKCKFSVEIR